MDNAALDIMVFFIDGIFHIMADGVPFFHSHLPGDRDADIQAELVDIYPGTQAVDMGNPLHTLHNPADLIMGLGIGSPVCKLACGLSGDGVGDFQNKQSVDDGGDGIENGKSQHGAADTD